MLAYMQGGASTPSSSGAPGSSPPGSSGAASSPSGVSAPAGTGHMGSSGLPSGSMGHGAQASMQNVLTPAFSSAIQGAGALTQLEQLGALLEKTRAETRRTEAETLTELERPGHVTESIRELSTRGRLQQMQTILGRAQVESEGERPSLLRAQAHSARATGDAQTEQATRLRRWGNSIFGGNIDSAERFVDRVMEFFGRRMPRSWNNTNPTHSDHGE